MDRREFLGVLGVAAMQSPEPKRRIWVDPRLEKLPRRPWRKIHLDFHNSQHVAKIGEKFNADEFGERLLAGNVDSIVVFAKDMHGYFYYPSKYGPVHPGLGFDLLGAQVAACRKRKIAVYAYYCTTWDNYLAEHHPEWLVVKRDRTTYLPKFDQTPGWTALCLSHRGFVDLMADHAREFVSRYELDGAWFDMPVPIAGECFCRECLRELKARGLDALERKVQREHKHELHIAFLKRMTQLVRTTRPGCQVDYNGQCVYGLGKRVPYQDNIDIEALPTASWGYFYFPFNTRYTRGFGVTTYGMTGRFKAAWADFGGLKLPVQLETEVASIVANAARCDIGDQMPPAGRLDPAVYAVIGKAYATVKEIEPYLEGAAPVVEAAIVTGGLPLEKLSTEASYGLLKLLMESRVQFDVVEPDAAWERYALVVLPDDMPVNAALAVRLHSYVAGGGAVIASHESGLLEGRKQSWLESYGIAYAGPSSFKPAYMIPKEDFTGGLPPYEYALYEGASQWRARPPAVVVAQLGEPAFQRGPQQYTSHRQTPFDHATEFAAIARAGRIALFGFPLGISYYNEGYWVYRQAFHKILRAVLPARIVESDAPLSTEITVTRQPGRYLVHIVNFSGLRRTPKHPDFYEDPIPLTDVGVRLNVPARFSAVKAVRGGATLTLRKASPTAVETTVPRIAVHEILSFEVD